MHSPFPGMDPFLEGHLWPDVHQSLANAIKIMLVPAARPKYLVRTNTYMMVDENMKEDVGIIYPDVELFERNQIVREPAVAYGNTKSYSFTPPTILLSPIEPVEVKIPVVEIRDKNNNKLVTAIEILSPVNKRNPGLIPYRKKRRNLYKTGVHLLEIDLLRRGTRPFSDSKIPDSPYLITLVRANAKMAAFWAVNMNEPLPIVPIPLKPEDEDIGLDLGKALEQVYTQSAYADEINYQENPPPPKLREEELIFCKSINVLN